jgi:hydroxyethylthiazole kinase-like uncharacterized protein yjeF
MNEPSDRALYSVEQIRAIEAAAQAGLAPGTLMQRAGENACRLALALLDGSSGPVLVLAGPGNNGGDALECAAELAAAGVEVDLVLLAPEAPAPSAEAAHALEKARAGAVRFVDGADVVAADAVVDEHSGRRGYRLAIDGLFGIGLARALAGRARALAEGLDALACPVLALDVPSGLDADTGAVVGPDGTAVRATHTITFLGDKPGLHTADGCDHAGQVHVDLLGADAAQAPPAQARINAPAQFAAHLRPRRLNSHKGSFGDVAVLGGAHGMAGALLLASRAALYAGAGKVFAAAVDPGFGVDPVHPEIMFRDAAGFAFEGRTVAAGPGMGDSAVAMRCLSKALDAARHLVLDADALNLIAASPELQGRVAARLEPALITPHPLEAARLLGVTAAIVQADRLEHARELAMRLNAVVVLKGAGTVIARP